MIPMEMTTKNEQPGNNLMAGLTGDILKKVTKNIADTMSQHAVEAIQKGVPYGHIIDQLINMSPVAAGIKSSVDLAGGGGQPPQLPNGNGGPPPPGGQPPATKNDQQQAPIEQGNNQAQPQGDQNSILMQLLSSIQNQGGGQILPPNGLFSKQGFDQGGNLQLGGMLDFQGTPLKNLGMAQELTGKKPMQIGELQNLIGQVGKEQLSANVVPLNAAQRADESYRNKKLAAGAYTTQVDNAKEQLTSLNQEQERATAEFNAMVNSRSWLGKAVPGTNHKMIDDFKAKLNNISERRDKAQENLLSLYGKHPNLKQNASVDSKDLIGKSVGKYKIVSVK